MPQESFEFSVVNHDEACILRTSTGAYRNLMQLLKDNFYLESFGSCGGMGRCATCLVSVDLMPEQELTNLDRNEAATLAKLGMNTNGLRLSCQILITRSLEGAVINLRESSEDCQ